jgi:MFS family permease
MPNCSSAPCLQPVEPACDGGGGQREPDVSATPGELAAGLRPRRAGSALASLALVTAGAGFGQFGAVATLGTVARQFGRVAEGPGITAQAGLPPTSLGAGLAIAWLASLGGMPLVSMADRLGRRRVLLVSCALGLALTAASCASPGYWWFIVIFAAGRPFLAAVYSVAQVIAAENSGSADRARAIALTAAGYGTGSGLVVVANSLAAGALGFRGVFALAVVPLMLLPVLARRIREPGRFVLAARDPGHSRRGREAAAGKRGLLIAVTGLALAMGLVTGPVNGFLFVYAQNVRQLPGTVIVAIVITAGVAGLLGLLAGRWLADHQGRRVAGAVSLAVLGAAGVLTYAGPRWAVAVGYPLETLAASMWVPAVGALVTELFPTRLRATAVACQLAGGVLGAAAGSLIFGAVAAASGQFGIATLALCVPVLVLAPVAFWLVPETCGHAPMDTVTERDYILGARGEEWLHATAS